MTSVYVDTSALLPLLDLDDSDHSATLSTLGELAAEKVSLITTSYTLVESSALVRNRLGMQALKALGDTIEHAATVVWVDEDLHRRAWAEVVKESRRGPSLVDWVGFLAAEDLGITTAFALDKHFQKRGFRTVP